MLRYAIALLFFLIFAVWLGIELGQDPGVALFAWHGTSVEMPLWFAACCLFLGFMLCWQLSRLFGVFPHSLYRFKMWRAERQLHRNSAKIRDGLLDLLAHRWQKAERHLSAGSVVNDLRPIPALGAAYAAHKLGDTKQRDAWLALAADSPAARLMQADFAADDRRPDQVIALLETHRKYPGALLRLQKAYRRLEKWESLFLLLPDLRKAGILSGEKAERLERKTARSWLAATNHLADLQIIWRRFPRTLQKDVRMVRGYIIQLMQHPDAPPIVAPLITTTLSRRFDPILIRIYGELKLPEPKKQLAQAEKWLRAHPDHPALLLTLGRLALRCRLWGKARGYLNDCLEQGKKEPDAHALLGWLDEQAGDPHSALIQYREGLLGLSEKTDMDF